VTAEIGTAGADLEALAGRVRRLEDRLAALDTLAAIFYETGYADALAPMKLAETARQSSADLIAKAKRQQMRRVQ
jgi:hypothetical protein